MQITTTMYLLGFVVSLSNYNLDLPNLLLFLIEIVTWSMTTISGEMIGVILSGLIIGLSTDLQKRCSD